MIYLQALELIVDGIRQDNANEIRSGANLLIESVSDVSISNNERTLALRLMLALDEFVEDINRHGVKNA